MLSSLSESGRKVLRERPGWIRKVNRELERKGAKVRAQYAVLGPYDLVTVLEAPDNETVSAISIEIGARVSVSMMTMPAIPPDSFIARLEQSCRHGLPDGGHHLRRPDDGRLERRLRRREDGPVAPEGGGLMPARHLIIGGGTAGLNCIRTIREEERERSEITLLSAERPYSRMVL